MELALDYTAAPGVGGPAATYQLRDLKQATSHSALAFSCAKLEQ